MKKHVQNTGIRRWFGQDFTELQSEPLKALEALLVPYESCVLSGCEVSGSTTKAISPGFVLFTWMDGSVKRGVIAEFAGVSGLPSTFTRYIYLDTETITRQYEDGLVKPVAVHEKAAIMSTEPVTAFVEITHNGAKSFREAIQTSVFRFVTDADKTNWNGKLNANEVVTTPSPSKVLRLNASSKYSPSVIAQDSLNRFVNDTEKADWNSKAAGNHNHSLAGLSEKSYNSLTDKPHLLVLPTGNMTPFSGTIDGLITPGFYYGNNISGSPISGEVFIEVRKSNANEVLQVFYGSGVFALRTRTGDTMGSPVWSVFTRIKSNPAASSGRVLLSDGDFGVDFSNSLHYDKANNRLGIGTASPTKTLEVNGEARVGSAFKTTLVGNEINFERNGFNYITAAAGTSAEIGILAGNRTFTTANCNVVFKPDQKSVFNGNVGVKTTPNTYELTVQGTIYASGNIIAFSDQRFKSVSGLLKGALNKIKNIRAVRYFWNADKERKPQLGLLAQELELQYPELVFTDDEGKKAINYIGFTSVLLAAIQEMSEEIEIIKGKL